MISPASGSIKCISKRAVVDLPQPDSPTTPSVSPFMTLKLMPSTACTCALTLPRGPRKGKYLRKPVTDTNRLPRTTPITLAHARTSIAVRRLSLSRLKLTDAAKIITPGSTAFTGAT